MDQEAPMLLRKQNIAQMKNETFDVAIIGAGINGAVAAAALSAKGVKAVSYTHLRAHET